MINSKYDYMQEGYKAYDKKFLAKDFLIRNWDNLSQKGRDTLFNNGKISKPCAITQSFVQNKLNWDKPIQGLEYVIDDDLLKYTFILSDVLIEVYKTKIDIYIRKNGFILITDLSNRNVFKEVASEICTLNQPDIDVVAKDLIIEILSQEFKKYADKTYVLTKIHHKHQKVEVYRQQQHNYSQTMNKICYFLKNNFFHTLECRDLLYCTDIYNQSELLEILLTNNNNHIPYDFHEFSEELDRIECIIRKEINRFIGNYFITTQFLHVSINRCLEITKHKASNYLEEISEYEKTLSDDDIILNLTIPLE